jgi:hypothetical protein
VVVIEDSTALEPEAEGEIKWFAPGVGKIRDEVLMLVDYGWKFRVPNRWVSHVTRFDGGFRTDIHFINQGESAAEMTLQPFAEDGAPLAPVVFEAPVSAARSIASRDLFGEAEVSHFAIAGPADCVVFAAYSAAESVSASAEKRERGLPVYGFSFFESAWNGAFFDGAALVNAGAQPASITAIRHWPDGQTVDTLDLIQDLAPNAKHRVVFGEVMENRPGSIIEIVSDQPISATALRGSLGEGPTMLWTSEAIEVRQTPPTQ